MIYLIQQQENGISVYPQTWLLAQILDKNSSSFLVNFICSWISHDFLFGLF